MPISEKPLAANRAEENTPNSALNGQRLGLTGAAFIRTDEDKEAFDRFSPKFIADLKPIGAVETSFAELIAQDHYRLRRAQAIEENIFSLGHYNRAGAFEADHPQIHDAFTQARAFDFNGKTFQNLSLYESRINRRMLNNLKAFHDLQDRRKAEERQAVLHAAKPKTKAASATASEQNDFVFSCTQTAPQPTSETPPQEDKLAA